MQTPGRRSASSGGARSAWLLAFATAVMGLLRPGECQDGVDACPTEVFACATNDECQTCLELLQQISETATDIEFVDCPTLYYDICITGQDGGCNTDNAELIDFAKCYLEEEFGCDGFVDCEDALANPPVEPTVTPSVPPSSEITPTSGGVIATVLPSSAPTDAPTALPTGAPTVAPTTAATTTAPLNPVAEDDDEDGDGGDAGAEGSSGAVAATGGALGVAFASAVTLVVTLAVVA